MYRHYWTDVTFEENIHSGYAMISCKDLGKFSEEVVYYEAYYHADIAGYVPGEIPKGCKISFYRNVFTIAEMIEHYQYCKEDIDSFTGQEYPEDQADYVSNPYLILALSNSIQSYNGWLTDGYPLEQYTLTEIKRLLGAY